MRDRTAVAILLVVAVVALVGFNLVTSDLPESAVPDAQFEATYDGEELVVEHAGGESFESESLRILVYEDRPLVPDRTVHGTIWEADGQLIQSGDSITLEDPRFETGQRLVVRWFDDSGQANVHESEL